MARRRHSARTALLAAALLFAPASLRAQPQPDGADSLAAATDDDADHDGLPSVIDQCPEAPETYNGTQDDDGCPDATLEEVALRGPIRAVVPLVGRRLQVVPEVTLVIDVVAGILRRNPGIAELTIEGHTDARGADAWNLRVSQVRAEVRARAARGARRRARSRGGGGPRRAVPRRSGCGPRGVAAQPPRALRGDALDERALARRAFGLRPRRAHSARRTSTFFRYSPSGKAASVG
jgi:hypothetical protein